MNERKRDVVTYLAYFVMLMLALITLVLLGEAVRLSARNGCVAELTFWRSAAVFVVTSALGGRVVSWW